MDALFTRTSVRRFTDEAVTEEQAELLMRAGMAAPSAGNQQPWGFYLTRDKEMLARLASCSQYASPLRGAALGIVVCAQKSKLRFADMVVQDLSAATENILIEAAALGLGAVWMGVAPDAERMRVVAEAIGNPEDSEPFALIAVGHPEKAPEPRGPKNYNPERIHWLS